MKTQNATAALHTATLNALNAGSWSEASRLLDALAKRSDVTETIPSVETFDVPKVVQGIIGDRIALVNSHVEAAWYARWEAKQEEAAREQGFRNLDDALGVSTAK